MRGFAHLFLVYTYSVRHTWIIVMPTPDFTSERMSSCFPHCDEERQQTPPSSETANVFIERGRGISPPPLFKQSGGQLQENVALLHRHRWDA